MKKRQRKKWLKKHGKYVPYSDLWSLDITIANFVLPRIKKFKKENIGYPVWKKWIRLKSGMKL